MPSPGRTNKETSPGRVSNEGLKISLKGALRGGLRSLSGDLKPQGPRAMSWAHRGRLSLPLKNRNSASRQYRRVEASGKRRDETRLAPPRSHRMRVALLSGWALYGVVGTVSRANEASIGGLMHSLGLGWWLVVSVAIWLKPLSVQGSGSGIPRKVVSTRKTSGLKRV